MGVFFSSWDPGRLKRAVNRFRNARVLVIGDIILDHYIWGDVSRISPEAPVPVVEVTKETKMLGGAANVINNLAKLGARPLLCGVIGRDQTGREIISRIEAMGLSTEGIVREAGRPTSIKTRIIAHNQQVVRFDKESKAEIKEGTVKKLLNFVAGKLKNMDVVVVSDYGKGVISSSLMVELRKLMDGSSAIVGVDPKTGNFEFYRGVDVITPNHHEAGAYCHMGIEDEATLLEAGKRMLEGLDCGSVLITRGKDGMTLFERDGQITHIPTVARKVYDVTGAGDTVISTLCLGLASGLDMKSSAVIANFAAGIVVGEVGTSAVEAAELKEAISRNHSFHRRVKKVKGGR